MRGPVALTGPRISCRSDVVALISVGISGGM